MIISFVGYGHSGKDTAAKALTGYTRRAFADPLKHELQAFLIASYGINPLNCTPEQKEFIRPYLVTHGERRRAANPQHWIDLLKSSIEYVAPADMREYTTPGRTVEMRRLTDVAITDCRYVNEAEWVDEQGGLVVLIVRPGCGPANPTEEQSIREIIASGLVSATIDNDGTIEELHEKTRAEVLR